MPSSYRSSLSQPLYPQTTESSASIERVRTQPPDNALARRVRSLLGFAPRIHSAGKTPASVAPDKPSDDRFNPSTHPSTGNVPRARNNPSGLAQADPEAWIKPLQRACINANNEVEARTLKALARSMLSDLKKIEDIISNPHPGRNDLPFPLKRRLLNETEKIADLLIDCINLEHAETDNIHFYLRDKFKKISERSKKIVAIIPKSHRASIRAPRAPVSTEAFLSDLFDDFSQFTNELKRHHFTHANDKQLEDYADKEYRRLLHYVPGLALQRKGSEMEYIQSASASLLVGHDGGGLKCGFEGKYTYSNAKKIFIDQDGSNISTQLRSRTYLASAVLKFGSLFPTKVGEQKHIAKFLASAQYKSSKGSWNEYKSLKDWKKAEIVYKGQQLKHRYRSGGPNSFGTRLHQNIQRCSSFVLGDMLGIKYIAKDLIPAVNQKKREKGVFNTDRIEFFATRISAQLQRVPDSTTSSLAIITRLAYPPINSVIPKDGGKANTELALDEKQFNSMTDAASMPAPAMAKPRQKGQSVIRHSVSGKIEGSFDTLDLIHPQHGQIHVNARGSVEVEWSSSHTKFMRLKAVHEHLDPRYSNDFKMSKSLLQEIISRDQPTAHGIKCLGEGFGARELHRHAALLSGQELAVKSSIMQTKFDHLYADIQRLDGKYAAFSDLAARKFSFREKSYREKNEQQYPSFKDDLKSFIENTFGLTEQNCAASRDKKQFLDRLLDDDKPDFFMIKGYDNLSTALGAIGIDIFDNNEKIFKTFTESEFNQKLTANEATLEIHRKNVDIRYQNLRNRMDAVFLPIDKEHLLRHMSIRAEGQTILSTRKAAFNAEAGIDSAPLAYSHGNAQGATALPNAEGSTDGHIQMSASSLGAGVALGISTLRNKIAIHSNPLRTGYFYDTRVTLSGEGVAAALIPAVVTHAEENLRKNNYLSTSPKLRRLVGLSPNTPHGGGARVAVPALQAVPAPGQNSAGQNPASGENSGMAGTANNANDESGPLVLRLSRLVGRSELSEFSRSGEIAVIRRTPYSDTDFKYKCLTQSVRFIERSAQKISLSGGVPLHALGSPVPMTASVGLSRSGSDGNVVYEILGPCPSYQILSFCEMQSVINKSGDSFTSFDPANLEPANFEKMRDLFLKKGGPDQQIDSDFLLHKFFGAPESILGFLDNYVDSQQGRREWGESGEPDQSTPRAVRPIGQRTEFDRIDDSPEYWKTMHSMRQSKLSAPGVGSIWRRPETADPRPKLDPGQIADIDAVKAYFDGRDVSPEERMRFFFETDTGRRVFEAYCQVLRAYEEISEAMKARNAYVPELVDAA
jgi:hypothetical protein